MLIPETAPHMSLAPRTTPADRPAGADPLLPQSSGAADGFRETLGRHAETAETARPDPPAETREPAEATSRHTPEQSESGLNEEAGLDKETAQEETDTQDSADQAQDEPTSDHSPQGREESDQEPADPDVSDGANDHAGEGEAAREEEVLVRRLLRDAEVVELPQRNSERKHARESAETTSKGDAGRVVADGQARVKQTPETRVPPTNPQSVSLSGEQQARAEVPAQGDSGEPAQVQVRAEEEGTRPSKGTIAADRREFPATDGGEREAERVRLARAEAAVDSVSRSVERASAIAVEAVATDQGRSNPTDRVEINKSSRPVANQEAAASGAVSASSPADPESSGAGGEEHEEGDQNRKMPDRQEHRRPAAEGSVSTKIDSDVSRPEGLAEVKLVNEKIGGKEASAATNTRSAESTPEQQRITAAARRGIMAAVHQKGGTVAIKLTPESLGSLRVQMELGGGRVSVRIESTTDVAHRALEQSIGSLRSAIESKGLKVESIQLQQTATAVSTPGASSQNTNTNHQQQGHHSGQNGHGTNGEHDAGGRESRGRDADREQHEGTRETQGGVNRTERDQAFRLALDATV